MANATSANSQGEVVELESIIIAALLTSPEKMPLISLEPEDFTHAGNREIFEFMQRRVLAGEVWDFETAYWELEAWRPHLNNLTSSFKSNSLGSMVPYYVRTLKTFQTRDLIKKVAAEIGDEDPGEFVETVQKKLSKITQGQEIKSLKEVAKEVFAKLERAADSNGALQGISAGLVAVDQITWGFAPKRLYILAARPSMGKSSLAYKFCLSGVQKHKRVYLQSMEASSDQVLCRLISMMTGISNENLNRGKIVGEDWVSIAKALSEIQNYRFLIDDTPSLTSSEICRRIRREHAREPIDLVVVDHIQELQDEAQNRHLAISKGVSNLRAIAKDLNLPLIALCQLSRVVEQGVDKKPNLSHLKESGDIEALADVVMLLYREAYYNPINHPVEIAEVMVAKNRDGRTGILELCWKPDSVSFLDLGEETKQGIYIAQAGTGENQDAPIAKKYRKRHVGTKRYAD